MAALNNKLAFLFSMTSLMIHLELLKGVRIHFDVFLPLFWDIVFGENCCHRAWINASAAVYALLRVDVEHFVTFTQLTCTGL